MASRIIKVIKDGTNFSKFNLEPFKYETYTLSVYNTNKNPMKKGVSAVSLYRNLYYYSKFKHRSFFIKIQAFVRGLYLASIVSNIMFLGFLSYFIPKLNHRIYPLIIFTIEQGGPTLIKLGQWASTRFDLFPKELCLELCKLHNRVKQDEFIKDVETIEKELNFRIIQPEKQLEFIGSGCIAQIYRCRNLKQNSTTNDVIFKVRRKGVVELISTDLHLLTVIASMIESIPTLEYLGLSGAVENFSSFMTTQLDFRIEAENILLFNENFKTDKTVAFPKVFFSSKSLLIESFEEGVSISDVILSSNVLAKTKVANIGLISFLKMVIQHNFTHCDLHPGNIIVRTKKNSRHAGRIKEILKSNNDKDSLNVDFELCYIDCGLVTSLSTQDFINFIALFTAVASNQGYVAGKLMIERSVDPHLVSSDEREKFKKEIESIVKNAHKNKFNIDQLNIGEILFNVVEACRTNHVKIQTAYMSLIIGIITIEGIGRELNKDINLFTSFMTFLNTERVYQTFNSV